MRKLLTLFAIAATFVSGGFASLNAASEKSGEAARKTAIFVNNLGGRDLEPKADILEAALTAELNGHGFSVLTPSQIAESLTQSGKREEDLGRMLTDNSSARALAATIGADYLLVAHLLGYNKRQVQYQGQGIQTDNQRYRLRVSYSLLEASQGGGLTGDTFSIEATERQQGDGSLRINDSGRLDDLISEAAVLIANNAIAKAEAGEIPVAPKAANAVNFSVVARIQGIALPAIAIDDNGRAQVSAQVFPVDASAATVELDGVALGGTPGTFSATPGLHQLRITRPGFQTWTRNVNLYEGFELVAALDFTPEGLRQWKDMTAFIERLKQNAQLTDAEAEAIRGEAQMLRQSGYRVDTKEAPSTIILQNGSIWEPIVPMRPQTIQQQPGALNTPQLQQGTTNAEAQPASAKAAAKAALPTIVLKADGNTYWNDIRVSAAELDKKLAELAGSPQPNLTLAADANIPLARVTDIVDKTREHKIRVQFQEL